MSNITADERTNTKNINLLSRGYEFEWEYVRRNRELIDVIMNKFDLHFDPKIKLKILQDNPDYDPGKQANA